METPSIKVAYAISASLLAVLVVTEYFYRQPLFEKSLEWIPVIQLQATAAAIEWWKFWTDIGLIGCIAVPLLILWSMPSERVRLFYYMATFSLIILV